MIEVRKSSLDGLSRKDIFIKENEEVLSYDPLEHGIRKWIDKGDLKIPVVSNQLKLKDHFGTLAVRTGFKRKKYKVPSGLYAFGEPDENSDVFVTCNYKYSFDLVRSGLDGLNGWILVLDTNGINVWCAAGKGTFSSRELIYQLKKWDLKNMVSHRELIVPQLGATQMEPHLVKRYSGFGITYGPIRSEDLGSFIENNKSATEQMRTVTFNLKDRLILSPVEMTNSTKYFIGISIFLYLLSIISPHAESTSLLRKELITIAMAFVGGTVFIPGLLPYLPFKYFSLKGLSLGTLIAFLMYGNELVGVGLSESVHALGMIMSVITIVSVLALIFTGSTTYTSYTGVDYETRKTVPVFIAGGLLSAILLIISKFI